MNTRVWVSESLLFSSFAKIPRDGISGSRGNCTSLFVEVADRLPAAAPCFVLPTDCKRRGVFASLPAVVASRG